MYADIESIMPKKYAHIFITKKDNAIKLNKAYIASFTISAKKKRRKIRYVCCAPIYVNVKYALR